MEKLPGGGSAQETRVALQGQLGARSRLQGYERDSALADHKLASIERMFTPPRLDNRNAAVQRVVDLN